MNAIGKLQRGHFSATELTHFKSPEFFSTSLPLDKDDLYADNKRRIKVKTAKDSITIEDFLTLDKTENLAKAVFRQVSLVQIVSAIVPRGKLYFRVKSSISMLRRLELVVALIKKVRSF